MKKLKRILLAAGIILSAVIIVASGTVGTARVINYYNSRIDKTTGIQECSYVRIGGIDQYVQIRGRDTGNPLILFIHGGPAQPIAYLTYAYQGVLEERYTVAHWDQRGSGRNFYANKKTDQPEPSKELILSDMDALTDYLLDRFGQEKIIIMGTSWGSILGSEYVQAHPEKVEAYIAIAPIVNTIEGAKNSSSGVLSKMGEKNTKDIFKLTDIMKVVEETDEYNPDMIKTYFRLRSLLHKYTPYENKQHIIKLLWSGLTSPDFTMRDLKWCIVTINLSKFEKLQTNLISECFLYNAYDHDLTYEVPVYIICGEFDSKTTTDMTEEYFNKITAPYKDITIFENAGHILYIEVPDLFCQTVIDFLDK